MPCEFCQCTIVVPDAAQRGRGRPPKYCDSQCRRKMNRLRERDVAPPAPDEGEILGAFRVFRMFINGQPQLVTVHR